MSKILSDLGRLVDKWANKKVNPETVPTAAKYGNFLPVFRTHGLKY